MLPLNDIAHYVGHTILLGGVTFLWNERRILKEVLEDGLERRHEHKGEIDMANPIADIQLALTILAEVRTALPILGKSIADLKQAYADKADATKAATDLEAVLTDLEPLLNQVMALVPPPAAPTVTTTTPPVA